MILEQEKGCWGPALSTAELFNRLQTKHSNFVFSPSLQKGRIWLFVEMGHAVDSGHFQQQFPHG